MWLKLAAWIACLSAIVVISFSAHAQPERYQKGLLVDTGEYDWCHHDCGPFDRPTYFFCVEVNGQTLVGGRDADWVWAYDSSRMFAFKGKAVSLRYNSDSIWILRPDGKEMRLNRDRLQDAFASPKCTSAVHQHWLQNIGQVARPAGVSASAVFVPEGPPSLFRPQGPHFWVTCVLAANAKWDICDVWNENGSKFREMKCTGPNGVPLSSSVLIIDPLTTKFRYEFQLTNGQMLHDIETGVIEDDDQ